MAACTGGLFLVVWHMWGIQHMHMQPLHLRRLRGRLKGDVGALYPRAEHRVLPLRVQQPVQREAQPPVARRPASMQLEAVVHLLSWRAFQQGVPLHVRRNFSAIAIIAITTTSALYTLDS